MTCGYFGPVGIQFSPIHLCVLLHLALELRVEGVGTWRLHDYDIATTIQRSARLHLI